VGHFSVDVFSVDVISVDLISYNRGHGHRSTVDNTCNGRSAVAKRLQVQTVGQQSSRGKRRCSWSNRPELQDNI